MNFSSVARVFSFASICLLVSFAHLSAQEEKVDINASFTGGTYSSPIKVTLKATQDNAKIFYSYNPDGTPDETHSYTGSLFLTKDTPLVFFAIVSNQNDSKIKINQYHFEYASGITLSGATALRLSQSLNNLSIINTQSGTVNLSFWKIKIGDSEKILDENTLLNSGSGLIIDSLAIGANTDSVVLYSPDEKEKARIALPAISQDITTKEVAPKKETYVPIVEPTTYKNTEKEKKETTSPLSQNTITSNTTNTPTNTPTSPTTNTPVTTTNENTPTPVATPNPTPTVTPETPKTTEETNASVSQKSAESITPVAPINEPSITDNIKTSSADVSSSFPIIPVIIILALLSILVRSLLAIKAQK